MECPDGAVMAQRKPRGAAVTSNTVVAGALGVYRNRALVKTLSIRDFRIKYRETMLGFWWMVLQPLLMLTTYALVFGKIFGSRWQGSGTTEEFVLLLFCGLTVYVLFSDTINRATTAIKSQPNFVKKVVFPLEILPIVILASSVGSALVNAGILAALLLLSDLQISMTALLAPFLMIPLLIMLSGLAWALSALSVFMPDLSQFITFLSSLLLFLSPVFFPLSAAPASIQPWILINPISFPIEELRGAIFLGQMPSLEGWAVYTIASCLMAFLGMWIFQSCRDAFADVI